MTLRKKTDKKEFGRGWQAQEQCLDG